MYSAVRSTGRDCAVQCDLDEGRVQVVRSIVRKFTLQCGLEEGSVQCCAI